MGGVFSFFSPLQRQIKRRRRFAIDNFSNQKFLLLGTPGCGKSSLVNSFNYTINLRESSAEYQEIAEIGVTDENKTKRLKKYDHREGMYARLTKSERSRAPTLFDMVGLPNRRILSDLLKYIADGRIPDDTFLFSAIAGTSSGEDERENLQRSFSEMDRSMTAWTILFIMSARENFPDQLAKEVHDACEAINDEKSERSTFVTQISSIFITYLDLERKIRIYVIITKLDEFSAEKQEEIKECLFEAAGQALNVNKLRFGSIVNFNPEKDFSEKEQRLLPRPEKQNGILLVFNKLLNPAHCKDPFEGEFQSRS